MSIDLNVTEGLPHTGIFTSDQGIISLNGQDIIRINRGSFTLNNSVAVYRENSKRTGITYAGIQRITGNISRAFINGAMLKLALGKVPSGTYVVDDIISDTELLSLLQDAGFLFGDNNYPPRVNISMDINHDQFPARNLSESETIDGYIHTFTAFNCIITDYILSWNNNGLVTSGPLNFIGSAFEWRLTPV